MFYYSEVRHLRTKIAILERRLKEQELINDRIRQSYESLLYDLRIEHGFIYDANQHKLKKLIKGILS